MVRSTTGDERESVGVEFGLATYRYAGIDWLPCLGAWRPIDIEGRSADLETTTMVTSLRRKDSAYAWRVDEQRCRRRAAASCDSLPAWGRGGRSISTTGVPGGRHGALYDVDDTTTEQHITLGAWLAQRCQGGSRDIASSGQEADTQGGLRHRHRVGQEADAGGGRRDCSRRLQQRRRAP